MYNFESSEADVLFICQWGSCQGSVPALGVVEIWVRKSLVEVITCRNANDAFALVMALPNRNTNPHVGNEHYNLLRQIF